MIRLPRIGVPPLQLLVDGIAATNSDVAQCNTGVRVFSFQQSIYSSGEVKGSLRYFQNNKCCYCEKSLVDIFVDVEHFRPKTGIKINGQRTLRRPGYFWLAYSWDNLLLACEFCNRVHKKNYFPLESESDRASVTHRDTVGEVPLLINPAHEDPETHIGFRDEYPFAIGGSVKGKMTIELVGLDRETLNEKRRSHLVLVHALYRIAQQVPPWPETPDARVQLERMVSDSGEYASCTRRYLQNEFGSFLP